jgi:hypothetical protein
VLSPDLPRSIAVGRFVLGMLPALLTVLFAGVIALLALLMDKQRRDYALQVANCFRKFAGVLVGAQSGQDDQDVEQRQPPRSLPPPDTG